MCFSRRHHSLKDFGPVFRTWCIIKPRSRSYCIKNDISYNAALLRIPEINWMDGPNEWSIYEMKDKINPLTTNVPYHIETSQLICIANQLTGFYMMGNIGRQWVNLIPPSSIISISKVIIFQLQCWTIDPGRSRNKTMYGVWHRAIMMEKR